MSPLSLSYVPCKPRRPDHDLYEAWTEVKG